MERNADFDEISDGRLYGPNDMVKAGCGNCEGCHDCCKGMGNSVVLDPFDVYRMTMGTRKSFMDLIALKKIALNVYNGVILPALAMEGSEEKCGFLNEQGRCSIHNIRPGICRLFPLGRIYREDGFDYFLQVNECSRQRRTKVKVRQWIDTAGFPEYDAFVMEWHDKIKSLQNEVAGMSDEDVKALNMDMLNRYYIKAYSDSKSFYEQFMER